MKPTSLLKRAKTFCATHHYRFTEPRERVLSLLIDAHEAMGAYQIIDALSSDQIKINPPTVYRAIEFWHTHGFIHRVESLNAYMACCGHKHHTHAYLFICDHCHTSVELACDEFPAALATMMQHKQLTMTHSATEIHGTCHQCSH